MALKLSCPDTSITGRHCRVLPCGRQRKRERIKRFKCWHFRRPSQASAGQTVVLHTMSTQSWRPKTPHQDPVGSIAQALRTSCGHNHRAEKVLQTKAPVMGQKSLFLPSGPKAPSLGQVSSQACDRPPASIARCSRYTMD